MKRLIPKNIRHQILLVVLIAMLPHFIYLSLWSDGSPIHLFAILLTTLIPLYFAWFLGEYFVASRLKRIIAVAESFASGNLEGRTGFSQERGEIGQLARALDQLGDNLARANEQRLSYEEEVKAATESLKESENKHRLLFENAGDAIVIHNDKKLLAVNRVACESLGYTQDELLSLSPGDIDTPEQYKFLPARFRKLVEDGHITFETEHLRKDRSILPIEATARIITWDGESAVLAVCRDICERKQMEQERVLLQQKMLNAQKFESLSTLAGGIAHDFNNILTTVIGDTELALMQLKKKQSPRENLERVEKAALRAARLSQQMLAYSGRGIFSIDNIDLNKFVSELMPLLEASICKNATLLLMPQSEIPMIDADTTQLRQIIMNLATNASEAIGQRRGTIAISTGTKYCDQDFLEGNWLYESMYEGKYVYLEVSDTGCGMSTETMKKCFDPFFTTRFTGRGLGLSAVHGIVRGHNGFIKVESKLDIGTRFRLFFPVGKTDVATPIKSCVSEEITYSGAVLLVDDEASVRRTTKQMLESLGFEVITASDGLFGIERFKERSDWRLVILDLTMPGMDGESCFIELQKLDPGVIVIISSGYSEQEVSRKFIGKGKIGFLQKPYSFAELRGAIGNVGNVSTETLEDT
jgi:PAS domain S-box-containing protein